MNRLTRRDLGEGGIGIWAIRGGGEGQIQVATGSQWDVVDSLHVYEVRV